MRKEEGTRRARAATAIAVSAVIALLAGTYAFALDESPAGGTTPGASAPNTEAPPPPPPESMSVVPEGEGSPSESAVAPKPARKKTHHATHAASSKPVDVEPAQGRLKVIRDDWIFSAPSKWSKHVMRAHAGKFVNVTGTTHYYLQVKLKEGPTGYISPSAVELVKPTDKIFQLTRDADVREEPNHWAKKVAEVHKGHNVHITGVALNYMKIRMKNGIEGFIPASALE